MGKYTLDIRGIRFRYRYLLDAFVCQLDVHAISVIAEDFNLVLVNNIATVTADEIFAELTLNGLCSAAQHIVAELAIGLIINLHVVILRLHIVKAVNANAHLEAAGTVNKVYQLGIGIVGLIIHHIHAYAVEQGTLMAIDCLLQTDNIRHNNDKRQHQHRTSPNGEELRRKSKIEQCSEDGIDERYHHNLGTYPRHQMYCTQLILVLYMIEDDFTQYKECNSNEIEGY